MANPKIELDVENPTDDQAREMSTEDLRRAVGKGGEQPAGEPKKEDQPTAEEVEAKRKADEEAALALTQEIEVRAKKEGKTAEEMRPIVEKEHADDAVRQEEARQREQGARDELEKIIKERVEKEGKPEEEIRAEVEAERQKVLEKENLESTVFAEKFKGPEALIGGVKEKVNELGYRAKTFEIAIELAKKTGEYTQLEAMYKELDAEAGARTEAVAAEAKKKEQERAAALERELPKETEAEQEQRIRETVRATYDELERSSLGEEFRLASIPLPHSPEELDSLWEKSSRLGFKFEQAYERTYNLLDKALGEHRKAVLRLPDYSGAVEAGELTKIIEFTKKFSLDGVKEDEIKALITEVYKEPANTESRNGVPYPIAGRAYQRFVVEHLDSAVDRRIAKAEMDGRLQHEDDLRTMERKTVKTISTAPIPSARRDEKPKVDVEDRDAVAGMTTEEIKKRLGP